MRGTLNDWIFEYYPTNDDHSLHAQRRFYGFSLDSEVDVGKARSVKSSPSFRWGRVNECRKTLTNTVVERIYDPRTSLRLSSLSRDAREGGWLPPFRRRERPCLRSFSLAESEVFDLTAS
jgi:hypothetical protein